MSEKKVRYARVAPEDNVALAMTDLASGEEIRIGGLCFPLAEPIPYRHKFAVLPMEPGTPVLKKGQQIGVATAEIRPGEHVHVHNMKGLA